MKLYTATRLGVFFVMACTAPHVCRLIMQCFVERNVAGALAIIIFSLTGSALLGIYYERLIGKRFFPHPCVKCNGKRCHSLGRIYDIHTEKGVYPLGDYCLIEGLNAGVVQRVRESRAALEEGMEQESAPRTGEASEAARKASVYPDPWVESESARMARLHREFPRQNWWRRQWCAIKGHAGIHPFWPGSIRAICQRCGSLVILP